MQAQQVGECFLNDERLSTPVTAPDVAVSWLQKTKERLHDAIENMRSRQFDDLSNEYMLMEDFYDLLLRIEHCFKDSQDQQDIQEMKAAIRSQMDPGWRPFEFRM